MDHYCTFSGVCKAGRWISKPSLLEGLSKCMGTPPSLRLHWINPPRGCPRLITISTVHMIQAIPPMMTIGFAHGVLNHDRPLVAWSSGGGSQTIARVDVALTHRRFLQESSLGGMGCVYIERKVRMMVDTSMQPGCHGLDGHDAL